MKIDYNLLNTFPSGQRVYDSTQTGGGTFIQKVTQTEIGHGMGLDDVPCNTSAVNCGWSANSVMDGFCQTNDMGGCLATTIQSCDNTAVNSIYSPPPPPPNCSDSHGYVNWDPSRCTCLDATGWPGSPIILAVGASADYQLVGTQGGVWFDLNADGTPDRIGWTRPGDLVGFLVLDRNLNGIIDNGQELFGNFTPLQAGQTAANGFEALALFDRPEFGGNANGWIDPGDGVWASLRIWIDFNHDGVSQPDELFTLAELNIARISTAAYPERRRDRFGNVFRLRGQFIIDGHARPAYDVYLAVARP